MVSQKEDFLKYQAATSPYPRLLEVERAEGSYIYTTDGKRYLDFVAGVSACTLGHCHPEVVRAIQEQCARYMHVMVYGEYVQKPAVDFCKLLAEHLPPQLNTTYLVNSGTEAIEGSVKLAKRATGRTQMIAAKDAYHGNTQGSMSLMGYEERKRPYRPLIPDVDFIEFNNEADILKITERTAGVVLESIQGGAGFIEPTNDYLAKVKRRCEEVGALLIIDEIQPGFGRTGKLFGFENYGFVPDIIAIGKGMASGMPVGAFVSSAELMRLLSHNPKMGHITTFGGNPVIAAASLATLKQLLTTDLMAQTLEKEKLFRKYLQHPLIESINGRGLMLAVIVKSAEICDYVVNYCQEHGLIVYWLLFEKRAVRLSPPLTLTEEEIKAGCEIIIEALDMAQREINILK
jgi:aminotransferase class-III